MLLRISGVPYLCFHSPSLCHQPPFSSLIEAYNSYQPTPTPPWILYPSFLFHSQGFPAQGSESCTTIVRWGTKSLFTPGTCAVSGPASTKNIQLHTLLPTRWKGRVWSTQDSAHTKNKDKFSEILVTKISAMSNTFAEVRAPKSFTLTSSSWVFMRIGSGRSWTDTR